MPARPELTAFGAGKVILLGEHAVVYGYPALAGPLSWGVRARGVLASRCALELPKGLKGTRRARVLAAFDRAAKAAGRPKVRVSLEGELPVSVGLGSSAALAVACSRLLLEAAGRPAKTAEVVRVALEMEREFHGTPSGVDHTCSAVGRLIRYERRPGTDAGRPRVVESPKPLKVLVVVVGDRPPTREIVADLRARTERWPARYRRILGEMGRLVAEGERAIREGDLAGLGDAMNVNHGLLAALQLSSGRVDEMVHRLRRMGALGAKLTGAGGDGGAVIGLFPEPEPVVARLSREGVQCFASQIAGPPAL